MSYEDLLDRIDQRQFIQIVAMYNRAIGKPVAKSEGKDPIPAPEWTEISAALSYLLNSGAKI